MLRVMFRSLMAHRVRLAMTALAIALGVGFMSGSFVFSATLTHSLDALITQASTGTDVIVQHSSPGGGYGSADSFAGGSLAMFSLPTAQQLFGTAGSYDSIEAKAAPGVSAQQLRDQVAQILPRGVTARTAASAAANQANQVNGQLSIFTRFFLVFAGVALFVGAFVIWNTFSIMIGQRTRELALLRTLGAGRQQVFRSVLAEAAIIGGVAALAGAGIGVALSKGLVSLLSAFGLSPPGASAG